MRIAHVTDCYLPRLGGIELLVHDLAARQRLAGHDVTVITPTPAGAGPAPAAEAGSPDPSRVLRLQGPGRRRLLPDLVRPAAYRLGREALRDGGFDAVHVHVSVISPLSFSLAHAAADAGRPTLVTQHSLAPRAAASFDALDLATGWTGWPVAWSAVSDVAAAPLRRVLGGRDVLVLPNAVDVQSWRVPPAERDPDEVVIVSVGRLARRKRAMPLVRMLRRLRAELPDRIRLRAVLVGEGPQRAALEGYLHRHRMAGWVALPGRLDRDRIRELYRRADLYLAPADLESFGIAALEARCAGVPVLAKAGSGIGEFVTHGRDGLLVGSDAQLVSALAELAADPAARTALALASRTTPPALTWDDAVRRSLAAYRRADDVRKVGRPAGGTLTPV